MNPVVRVEFSWLITHLIINYSLTVFIREWTLWTTPNNRIFIKSHALSLISLLFEPQNELFIFFLIFQNSSFILSCSLKSFNHLSQKQTLFNFLTIAFSTAFHDVGETFGSISEYLLEINSYFLVFYSKLNPALGLLLNHWVRLLKCILNSYFAFSCLWAR